MMQVVEQGMIKKTGEKRLRTILEIIKTMSNNLGHHKEKYAKWEKMPDSRDKYVVDT